MYLRVDSFRRVSADLAETADLLFLILSVLKADILSVGNDRTGKSDEFGEIWRVKYLSRTQSNSTTVVIEKIKLR